jgi:soluble lytic murein transglycosylase-like protein
MQILYGTAKQMGYSGEPEGLFDPETNIRYATAYQVWLYNRYHDWNAVIHSYNEGPGNYDKGKRVPTYFGRVYARWGKWDLMLSASGDISA